MSIFTQMAARREEEANQLSDEEIFRVIIEKNLKLTDFPIAMRANMILDSVSDFRFIFEELKNLKSRKIIDTFEMVEILRVMSNRVLQQ